jgi:hypothetical protein
MRTGALGPDLGPDLSQRKAPYVSIPSVTSCWSDPIKKFRQSPIQEPTRYYRCFFWTSPTWGMVKISQIQSPSQCQCQLDSIGIMWYNSCLHMLTSRLLNQSSWDPQPGAWRLIRAADRWPLWSCWYLGCSMGNLDEMIRCLKKNMKNPWRTMETSEFLVLFGFV